MPLSLGFVAGVTPTKWTRTWAERRPDIALEVFRTDPGEQVSVLRDGRADVSLVRLPIDAEGLSVIPLYREIPVVVAAKDHPLAVLDTVPVAELAAEHLLQDPDSVPEWRRLAQEVENGTRRSVPEFRDLDEAVELVAAGVGILILPHSLARLHNRKDVIARPVEGVADSEIALAWVTARTSTEIEEFVGIVRGRTSASSRGETPVTDGKKEKKTAKAKAAAKAARAASEQANPARKRHENAPGRTRVTGGQKDRRRGRR